MKIFEKEYHGFEAIADLGRDIYEMWDYLEQPIPGEFQGTVKVIVEYIEEKEDNK